MLTVLPHPHENQPCIKLTGMDWGGFHVLLRLWSIYRNRVFILHCWQAIPSADCSKCDIYLKVLPDKCRIELFLSICCKLSSKSIPTCWHRAHGRRQHWRANCSQCVWEDEPCAHLFTPGKDGRQRKATSYASSVEFQFSSVFPVSLLAWKCQIFITTHRYITTTETPATWTTYGFWKQ